LQEYGLKLVPDEALEAVFAAAGCVHTESTDASRLPSHVRRRLASFAHLFASKAADERTQQLLRGTAPLKVQVAEVMATFHPARWCTSPDAPAHALVVRPGEHLSKGEAVCLYAGTLWDRPGFEREYKRTALQYYAYDVPPMWSGVDVEARAKLQPPYTDMPDLVVESLHSGGVGRFINDCWGRKNGEQSVNVEPHAVWDAVQQVPAIVMVVTAPGGIGPHEELVSNYGPEFWKIVWRDLRVLQTEFWRRCSARVSFLEARLAGAQVPLPRRPDVLAGPLFVGTKPALEDVPEDAEAVEEVHDDAAADEERDGADDDDEEDALLPGGSGAGGSGAGGSGSGAGGSASGAGAGGVVVGTLQRIF
jgi:hypothetical protein